MSLMRLVHQFHPVDVQRLSAGVFFSHEHHAGHVHQRRGRGRSDTVLSGAGLGNQAGFAHLLCQKRLSQDIVDLMRARVVQVLPLEIDLRTAQVLCHLRGIVEPGRSSRIVVE